MCPYPRFRPALPAAPPGFCASRPTFSSSATPARRYVSGETHLYLGRQYRLRLEQAPASQVKLIRGRPVVHTSCPTNADHTAHLLRQWYQQQAAEQFQAVLQQCLPLLSEYQLPTPTLHSRRTTFTTTSAGCGPCCRPRPCSACARTGCWPARPARAVSGAGVERLLFRYHYDGQGQLTEKQVPDTDGYQYTVYDALDRPMLAQDVAQQATQEWVATKYDALGRGCTRPSCAFRSCVGRPPSSGRRCKSRPRPAARLSGKSPTPASTVFGTLLDAVQPVRQALGRPHKRPAKLHADKGYDFCKGRLALRKRGSKSRITRRGVESSQRLGRHRWVVERAFALLNRFRRLCVRYERRDDIYLDFTKLACALITFIAVKRFC